MRKDLAPAIKQLLRDSLLGMNEDPEGRTVLKQFGAISFIPTTAEDYAPVFEIAEEAKIDLGTYEYLNR
jgi:ABC-type phosphate/phosphonate transport system substrate-binding protein